MPKYIGVAALSLFGMACDTACTLIGCESGLTLQWATPATGPIHIEATSADGGSRSLDCDNSAGCRVRITVTDYVPQNVTLTVTYQGRTSTTTVRPDYTDSTPNGKGCGPECRAATVVLFLP